MQRQYGKFSVLNKAGDGGFGDVFEAYDPHLEMSVAIKVPHQHQLDGPDASKFVRAFTREAQRTAKLIHPNIVEVREFYPGPPVPFIVMEFIPDNLKLLLRGEKTLPAKRAVEIAVQVCKGLGHAHHPSDPLNPSDPRPVFHCDLKPSNILLTPDDIAKVADFGIARIAENSGSSSNFVGFSLLYAPPEQRNQKTVDLTADVYALGVTLYEMLTGEVPFKAETADRLQRMHESDPVPPMSSALKISPQLEAVVRRDW